MIASAISASRSSMIAQGLLQDRAAGVRVGRGPFLLGALGGAVGLVDLVDRGDVIEASFSPSYGLKSMMSQEPLPGRHSPSMYCWARSVK